MPPAISPKREYFTPLKGSRKVHRRYALGDPADPPPRRHFSMTPDTRVPGTRFGSGGFGASELGVARMEVGDGMRMPCRGAERGLGARLIGDWRDDPGFGVEMHQMAIADDPGFGSIDLLDDALEIDGQIQCLVTGMTGPLLELERIVLDARAVLVQAEELTLGDLAAYQCLGAGGLYQIWLVIADVFNNKIGLLDEFLAELAAFATGILIHRGVPDEVGDNRVDGFHADGRIMVDDYRRLQKEKVCA